MQLRKVLPTLGLLLAVGFASAAPGKVGWMVYPYHIPVKDEDYQRLLTWPDVEYVGLQWAAQESYAPSLTQQRAAELRRAGKKLIADLWFGPSKPFSWRYFNFPNIALDPQIRGEFFSQCVDPWMKYWGAENLYAVHLMEETGMQFGWDADVPGYPDDVIGFDTPSSYDNPSSFRWSRSLSGPNVLTIRKFADRLKADTGLDLRLAAVWSGAENTRFNTWVQQKLEAGAHIQFAKYVHQKYPGVRVYAFNTGVAVLPQREVLDGQFLDPYIDTASVYTGLRNFRSLIKPDSDLVAMMWGNRDKPQPRRMPQQAACYLAGADILSTYGDRETESDEWMKVVHDSVKPFLGLPRFESRPRVLYLGGDVFGSAVLTAGDWWITGFAHYDVADAWMTGGVPSPLKDLSQYQLIFAWNRYRPELEPWVRQGGILVGVWSGGELLEKAGVLEYAGKTRQFEGEYRPSEWMRQNLRLRESYQLDLKPVAEYAVKKPQDLQQDQFLYVAPYGKGLIVHLPAIQHVHPPWQYEPGWEVYRQFLTDLCRGALQYRGLEDVADDCFDDPALGNDYLKMTSSDGKLTVYVLLNDTHGPNRSTTSFVVPGRDRVTGLDNVTFGEDHPVVMIEKGGN